MTEFSSLTALPGGWSGRTFLGEVAGEKVVVRIFPPEGPAQAVEVQAALLRLVRGLLPVPEVLEVRRPDVAAGAPGLLVTEHLPGLRGDLVVDRLDDAGRARLGARVGELVGTLGGMPTARVGLFDDADLAIKPFALAEDLTTWIEDHDLAGLTAEEKEGLLSLAVDAQALLDTATRSCLVHSDLNPKNLLVDPDSLEVTGLVDWEFAHSGHPATDLGNALRFERRPAWQDAVLSAYRGLRGGDPAELLDTARAADLWALVDLAERAGQNPVCDRALGLVRAVATTGDLHAAPADS